MQRVLSCLVIFVSLGHGECHVRMSVGAEVFMGIIFLMVTSGCS